MFFTTSSAEASALNYEDALTNIFQKPSFMKLQSCFIHKQRLQITGKKSGFPAARQNTPK